MQGDLGGSSNEGTQRWQASRTVVGPRDAPDTYELQRVIGAGGEGEVWQALARPSTGNDDAPAATVALKMFAPETPLDPAWHERVESFSAVHHPGLARVIEGFTGPAPHLPGAADDGSARNYLVLELVAGLSLQEWLGDHPDASLSERLVALGNVASALSALHRGDWGCPLAHGDVKPDNIRLCGPSPSEGTKLVDFGLLQPNARPETARPLPVDTLGFAAPELVEGGFPTPSSDVFAFAATVFATVTGEEPPLRGDGLGPDVEAMVARLREHPSSAVRPQLPDLLEEGLATDPGRRPPDVARWLNAARTTSSAGAAVPSPRRGRHVVEPSEPAPGREEATGTDVSPRLVAVALPTGIVLTAVVALVAWGGGNGVETFPAGATPSPPPIAAPSATDATGQAPGMAPGMALGSGGVLGEPAPAGAQPKAFARRGAGSQRDAGPALAARGKQETKVIPAVELSVLPTGPEPGPTSAPPAVLDVVETPGAKTDRVADQPRDRQAASQTRTVRDEDEADHAPRAVQNLGDGQRRVDRERSDEESDSSRSDSQENSSGRSEAEPDRSRSDSEEGTSDRGRPDVPSSSERRPSDTDPNGPGRGSDPDQRFVDRGWSDRGRDASDRGWSDSGQGSSGRGQSDRGWSGSDRNSSSRGRPDSRQGGSGDGWGDRNQNNSDRGRSGSDQNGNDRGRSGPHQNGSDDG